LRCLGGRRLRSRFHCWHGVGRPYAVELYVYVEITGRTLRRESAGKQVVDAVGDEFVDALADVFVDGSDRPIGRSVRLGVYDVVARPIRSVEVTVHAVEIDAQRVAHRLALGGVEPLQPLDEIVVGTERDLTHRLDICKRVFESSFVSDDYQPSRLTRGYRSGKFKSTFIVPTVVAVTFDLFGTLVSVDAPDDPAAAVAAELRARDVSVPADWAAAYAEPHIDAPSGAEVPLPAHVAAALRSRGVDAPNNAARRAVVAAFDPRVSTREGAIEAVEAAAACGPVGLLSNCSVPELVSRTLIRSELERGDFEAIVTSVGCGWRKPHPNAFETIADGLGARPDTLVHVGDDEATDGGVGDVGGTFLDVTEDALPSIATRLRNGTLGGRSRCP